MNLVQTNLLHEVALEVKAQGGPTQFKAHALKNLELRTVLKESHGSPILDLVFNSVTPGHHNLFASIGKDQVTIYDDEHMGDYLGVVVHYVNSATPHHRGGDVSCCAWIQTAGISRHELGDACLAVSGPEGVIQVISVVEARVVALLKGHTGEVTELRGCAGVPGLLLSLGCDGSMRLWDVAAGACLAALECADITTAELHPDGSCIYTGHRGGRVSRWPLQLERKEAASASATASPTPGASCFVASPRLALAPGCAPAPVPLSLPANPPLGDYVDCIRVLPGGRLAAKSSDGRLAAFDLAAGSSGAGGSDGTSGGTSGAAEAGVEVAVEAAPGGEAAGGSGASGAGGVKEGEEGAARQVLSLRVPGTHPASSGSRGGGQRCRFSATRDGAFICVGNSAGDVYVYDAATGSRAAHHPAHKVGGPARAAALSEDGRHLLVVRGNGYILRYEYIRKLDSGAAADPSSREVSPDPPGVEAAAGGKRGAEEGEEGQRRVRGRAAAEGESEREGSADPEWSCGMEE